MKEENNIKEANTLLYTISERREKIQKYKFI